MEKYHKTDICPVEKENERDKNYEASRVESEVGQATNCFASGRA